MESYYYPGISPTTPKPPKTTNYTFTAADDGVPVVFNASAGDLTGILPDPATVAGRTFIAKRWDSSANAVNLIGAIDGMTVYSLTDQNASVVLMAANGVYVVIANYTP